MQNLAGSFPLPNQKECRIQGFIPLIFFMLTTSAVFVAVLVTTLQHKKHLNAEQEQCSLYLGKCV
jgi:hypothetical protein